MSFDWPNDYTVEKRIGIGKEIPLQALDVIGNISATGDISATNLNLSGTASAAQFMGDGSSLTGLVTSTGNSTIDGSLTINQNLAVSGNFQLGTLSVNEFSSDGNLADNSNLAVPTEQAVKTYVDNQITQVNNALDTKAALNGAPNQDFATNNLSVDGSLTVGNAIATMQLSVSGSVTGSLTIENDLTVNNAIATRQLSVSDTVKGSLTIENDLTVGNAIATRQLSVSDTVKGSLTIESDLTVGNAISTQQLSVTDRVTGSLTVENDLIIGGLLSTNGSAQFVTNTGNNPVMISRLSNADNQVVKISVDDAVTTVHYINDENRNRIDFRLQNTDTETGAGANANDNVVMTLVGDPSNGRVGIGTTYPSKKLSVKGAIGGSGEGLYFDSSRPNTIINSEVIKQAEAAQKEARQAIQTAQTAAEAAAEAVAQTVVRARQTLQAAVILMQIGSSFPPSFPLFPLGQQLVAIATAAQAQAGFTIALAVVVQQNAQKVEKLVGAIPDAQEAATTAAEEAAEAVGAATATRQSMQKAAQLAARLGRPQEADQANQAAQALEESAQKTLEQTAATQEAEQQVAEAVNNPFVEIYAHGISARQENSLIYDTYSFHRWKVRDVERMRLEQNGNFYLNSGNLKLELGNLHIDKGNLHIDKGNLHIDKGNVGIGTKDPAAKLEVAGGETILQQESWQTPSLLNGWVNYGSGYNSAGYFKDSLGIVHLKGLVRNGTENTIFTLPSGYRPSARELHGVSCNRNTIGRVDILTNGTVQRIAGDNRWISLDGITFRAG